jgi:mono/diheme cytochrome c family protein
MRLVHFTWLTLLATGCAHSVGEPPIPGGPTPGPGGGGGDIIEPGFGGGPAGPPLTVPVIAADPTPPPISGGTLVVLKDGATAVVSDPDRDQIVVVDVKNLQVIWAIALTEGDEPGRLIEDGKGNVHVALRSGGALVTIDPVLGRLSARRAICDYPRGVAYDAKTDALHVACAGGELVTLPAAGGDPTRRLLLDRDLRDVVVDGDGLWVSRFRSAQVLRLDATGQVVERLVPPSIEAPQVDPSGQPGIPPAGSFAPAVAWRMIAASGGGALLFHQKAQTSEVVIQPGGYGGFCGGIVQSGVTIFHAGEKPVSNGITLTVPLPVDGALTPDGTRIAIVAAGSMPQLNSAGFGAVSSPMSVFGFEDMQFAEQPQPDLGCGAFGTPPNAIPVGQAVAVAYLGSTLVVQTREPSMLMVGDRAVALPGDSREDTGHMLFHMATGSGTACASCHPEGREDGRVWNFNPIGSRRTQSIRGGLLGTEPFHWDGDMKDFSMLAHEVMGSRMLGPGLGENHVQALSRWIDRLPALKAPTPSDAAAAERGRVLFTDMQVGCGTCHMGTKLTSNLSLDVGTGGVFQVPSLVGIGWRDPFLHDGCAPTLGDRFGACGGAKHGNVSTLGSDQIADLVSYLGTL